VPLLVKFFAAQSEFVSYSVPIVTHNIRHYLTSWPATPFGEARRHQITHCVHLRGRWSEWTHGVSASSCPPINSFIDENMLPFKNGSTGTKQKKYLILMWFSSYGQAQRYLSFSSNLHFIMLLCVVVIVALVYSSIAVVAIPSPRTVPLAMLSHILISTLSSRTCARCLW